MTRKEWKRRNTRLWLAIALAAVYDGVYRLGQGIMGALYGNRDRY